MSSDVLRLLMEAGEPPPLLPRGMGYGVSEIGSPPEYTPPMPLPFEPQPVTQPAPQIPDPSGSRRWMENFGLGLAESPVVYRPRGGAGVGEDFVGALLAAAANSFGAGAARGVAQREAVNERLQRRAAERNKRNIEASEAARQERLSAARESARTLAKHRHETAKEALAAAREAERDARLHGYTLARDAAADARKNAGVGGGGYDPETLKRIEALSAEVQKHPDVKDFVVVRNGYEMIRTGVRRGDAVGDMATIFGYMKMLDPNSTVREGEYATAEDARGVPAAIIAQWNRLVSGEKLAPAQRLDYESAAESLYGNRLVHHQRAERYFRRRAAGARVPFEEVWQDLSAAPALPAAAPPPPLPRGGFPVRARFVRGPDGQLMRAE